MSGVIEVSLVYAPGQRQVRELVLSLPAGSTLQAALAASGWLEQHPELAQDLDGIAVWGRRVPLDQPLRAHDRIEICRPLRVDPRHARRERFDAQGARAAGLFARRRPGAKPGY